MPMRTTYTTVNGQIVSQMKDGVSTHLIPDTNGNVIAAVNSITEMTDPASYWPDGQLQAGEWPGEFGPLAGYGYSADQQDLLYGNSGFYTPSLRPGIIPPDLSPPNGIVNCTPAWNQYVFNYCSSCPPRIAGSPPGICHLECDQIASSYYKSCNKPPRPVGAPGYWGRGQNSGGDPVIAPGGGLVWPRPEPPSSIRPSPMPELCDPRDLPGYSDICLGRGTSYANSLPNQIFFQDTAAWCVEFQRECLKCCGPDTYCQSRCQGGYRICLFKKGLENLQK